MSILLDNRALALQAHKAFESISKENKAAKFYLNAVQQALLKLETQGLRRSLLYITSQMGKKTQKEFCAETESFSAAKAYHCLYHHLADMAGEDAKTFSYQVLRRSEEDIVLLSSRVAFFLLCLKRLASAQESSTRK